MASVLRITLGRPKILRLSYRPSLSLIKANSCIEDHLLRHLLRGAVCSFEFFSQHLCRSLSITARCIHPRSSGGGRNRRNCVSLHPTSTAAATATATTFSPEQLTANDRARPPHQIIFRIIYVKTSSLPRISLCAQHRSFLSSTSIPQYKACLRRSHPPQTRHICSPPKLASADSASGLKHVLRLRSLAQCQALSSKPDIIGSRPL